MTRDLPIEDDDPDADGDEMTLVDNAFWRQPEIPRYPALARFGRFEILGRIARGGMAEIFLARDTQADGSVRHVVVKRVLPEMEDNPDFLALFLEEGRTATRLYHTNVCHVYECGEIDGRAFMALEWVYGTSLHEVLRRASAAGQPLAWPVAVEIASLVAGALHYVHHAKGVSGRPLNIVHRDVSPHNVMISWTGQVKLLDFGIAKTNADGSGGTAGKYGYMSPEQARSQPVDARSDIFALGVVLFEMLAGRALYDRPTVLDTLSAVVREPVPSLRAEQPALPEALEHIVERALAKDPSHRFQTAGEMRAALKQVLRAHNQSVADVRIALALDGLFKAPEKAPLKPDGQVLSGSFPVMPGVAAAAQEVVTYGTFEHASEAAPNPADETADIPARKKQRKSGLGSWIAFVLLFVLAASAGAAAAIFLLT